MTGAPMEQIGPYTVESEIGRGGMGVVYLATDTRLDRKAAIKALPEHFAMDPERLSRFVREAKLLASMTHPNIAGVYGLEEQNGSRYLVMEYVEGEPLSAIIGRGALAVDEALRLAAQIASGVEAAHETGVIHRDLKPGNIVVTIQGAAKVLDFGLAKEVEGRGSSLDLSRSPTATLQAGRRHETAEGQIVGTAAYLSPEQARGKSLDRRTDIWAFGCVLYEMLTGHSPYAGETATDSLGAILHKEPEWERLPADTPPTIALLLRRMLAKDPDRRLRDMGDARVEIEDALRDPSATSLHLASVAMAPGGGRGKGAGGRVAGLAAAIFAVIAAGLGARSLMTPEEPALAPMRLKIDQGVAATLTNDAGAQFAISPDGSMIVFAADPEDEPPSLYVRSLDQFDARILPGTEGAEQPFFSPDGQWIGFFDNSSLKKISVSGGAPLTLCELSGRSRGGSWADDGTIYFSPGTTEGLRAISSAGGTVREVTTIGENERSHRWPHALPGSRYLLLTVQRRGTTFDQAAIELLDLESGERTLLHEGGSNPKYLPSGHVTFGSNGTVYAAPFDLASKTILANPAPVLEGVGTESPNGGVKYAISASGTLLYGSEVSQQWLSKLVWIDRSGARTVALDQDLFAIAVSLSPDNSRAALQIFGDVSSTDIWIYEFERSVLSRLTSNNGEERNPIWSPDGREIIYSASPDSGDHLLLRQLADGSAAPQTILRSDLIPDFPASLSPDGSVVAFVRNISGQTSWDLWTSPVDTDGAAPKVFLEAAYEMRHPVISPDGRWMAYSSDESGRREIYVRSYPSAEGRWQISTAGGQQPVWSPDGSELFFHWDGAWYAVSLTMEESSLRIGRPEKLFDLQLAEDWSYPQLAVSNDGQRFLALEPKAGSSEVEQVDATLSIVLNWFTVVEQLAGPGGQ